MPVTLLSQRWLRVAWRGDSERNSSAPWGGTQVINAGQAKPSPPVGPALGQARSTSHGATAHSALTRKPQRVSPRQAGLNIMAFCKEFNAKTQGLKARARTGERRSVQGCLTAALHSAPVRASTLPRLRPLEG